MRARLAILFLLFVGRELAAGGLDPSAIRSAAGYSAGHGGTSLFILQSGKTLLQEHAGEARKIYSGTKAFWCLAALAAEQDGLLKLDERVAETIPAWREDARKSRVTIRQLLDFSCGLEPGFRLHADDPGNRDVIAIGLPMVAEPGRAFIYGPSSLQVFHAVLKAKLGGKNWGGIWSVERGGTGAAPSGLGRRAKAETGTTPRSSLQRSPRAYLERRVLRRLGLGSQRYLLDHAGNPLLAAGWILSAQQWSRLGQLALADGAPVVPAESFAQTQRGSSANRAYSLGWWNNRAAPGGREFDFEEALTPKWSAQNWDNACVCRDAPSDLMLCIGSRYQRLYVLPSLKVVVVRHGNGGSFSDARFLRLLLGRER